MIGFSILMGHLFGDYIVQNDWMAGNKTNPRPKLQTWVKAAMNRSCDEHGQPWGGGVRIDVERYREDMQQWWLGNLTCLIHCLLYTAAVVAFNWWWMPWWGYLVCFLAHFPVDRYRLARWWMDNVSGQSKFAHMMGPWSVILVDNTFHLFTLYVVALIVRPPWLT